MEKGNGFFSAVSSFASKTGSRLKNSAGKIKEGLNNGATGLFSGISKGTKYAIAGVGALLALPLIFAKRGKDRMDSTGSPEKKEPDFWLAKIGRLLARILRALLNPLSLIVAVLLIFLIYTPVQASVINLGKSIPSAFTGIANLYDQTQKRIACGFMGECPTTGEARDLTKYGIFFDSVYTGRTNDKFYQDENIKVTASANAEYLTSMDLGGCARLSCEIDDGTAISKSRDCIPLTSFPTKVICTYAPITSSSTNLKKASVKLTYDFQASTKIPISVVDAADYDKKWNSYKGESSTVSEVDSKIAYSYGVAKNPPSDPKLTPLVIGAKINKNQPIPKGASDVWLSVSIQNEGGGTAIINKLSLELPKGMSYLGSEEINLDVPNPIDWTSDLIDKYVLKKDQLSSISDELVAGDFRVIDLKLGTSGFPLESLTEATTKKITVYVDYTYTTVATKMVMVQTCSEVGGCSAADSGSSS